jgi:Endosomal/lysosomal potassium channel TMEM175
MIRKFFSSGHSNGRGGARKRDFEIQRIETFSDGVFAFAITLLIVSLEVPKTFEDLLTSMRGFFPFAISFAVLISIWSEQHRFFRKYGMEDGLTIVLNSALLFIVLFYTYPLKFLFTLMFSEQIYGPNKSPMKITGHQIPTLMMIYALGFVAIYFLFFLLHLNAYKKSSKLGFTPLKKFDCKTDIYKEIIMGSTGVCSLIVSLLLKDEKSGFAGYLYMLIFPALTIFFIFRKRSRIKLFPHTVLSE